MFNHKEIDLFTRYILALALLIILGGIFLIINVFYQDYKFNKLEPSLIIECRQKSGIWENGFCLTSPDTGKTCTDVSDCIYQCISPEGSVVGAKVEGTCMPMYSGNYSEIKDGVVQPKALHLRN